MNYCPDYETRILEADPSVEAHLSTCEGCQAFAAALAEVDAALTVAVRRSFAAEPPPPLWPELLDMAGWTSVLAAVIGVAVVMAPGELTPWCALAGAVSLGSAWFGLRSWRELRD